MCVGCGGGEERAPDCGRAHSVPFSCYPLPIRRFPSVLPHITIAPPNPIGQSLIDWAILTGLTVWSSHDHPAYLTHRHSGPIRYRSNPLLYSRHTHIPFFRSYTQGSFVRSFFWCFPPSHLTSLIPNHSSPSRPRLCILPPDPPQVFYHLHLVPNPLSSLHIVTYTLQSSIVSPAPDLYATIDQLLSDR